MQKSDMNQQRHKSRQKQKKTVGKFIIYPKEILGQGSFGIICLARLKNDSNYQLACKILNKDKLQEIINNISYMMNRVREQMKVWKELDHPNIVKFQGSEQTKNNIYFFSTLCSGGTLEQYIAKNRFGINIDETIKFCKQIISACAYLELKGIVHRDIKPANIFLKDNNVQIGDFGLARVINQQDNSQAIKSFITFAGTLHFMAPEILQHKKYSSKCDVWSVGITIFMMLTSELPFGLKPKDQSEKLLIEKIKNRDQNFKYKIFDEHEKIKNILQLMLQVEVDKRLKMSEADKLISEL